MRLLIVVSMVSMLSSCGFYAGSPSGLRELNRGAVGLASIEKQDTPFHELERTTEKQKTLRIRLAGGSDGSN